TRVRTYDLLVTAPAVAERLQNLFSVEMWGGATFDTALRFLHEDPWQRLRQLRAAIPNICFQMLLRGANAVGYASYPDNVIREFVREAFAEGMDIFRVFDSLNSVENMRVSLDAVLETGGVCEAAICYTGDILDHSRPKYSLKYYVALAKQLEKLGVHFLAIKDMAGLCKPYAAFELVKKLKEEIALPIHFHTHDTSGINAASVLKAAGGRVDDAGRGGRTLSGGGWRGYCRRRGGIDDRRNQPAQLERDCRVFAKYAARHRARSRDVERVLGLLGNGAYILSAVRFSTQVGQCASLRTRNSWRTVHELARASSVHGAGPPLARGRTDVRRSESTIRRHCESD